ncbi:hypothetical protein [Cereibacter sphaeroides]|uniref:hypothetical protein n=1 Tax=Cereibacter sphaeroides TaxID=1063 RepID=UPI001F2B71F7|nr:hypothetical protein [Cereibacter sphaeroides]MCE6967246.1 hypothetical protein [Cereibacter sphaeroides]
MSQTNKLSILASLVADSMALDTASPRAASALFWRARYLQEAAILPHLPFIFWLSSILRPRSYVETGMTEAVSYFAVCQTMDKISPDGVCTGIWRRVGENSGVIPERVHWRNTELYTEFSNIVVESPAKVAANIRDGSVDLLLVNLQDGDTLVKDWTSKLSECAVVLLHGTRLPEFSDTSSAAMLRDLGALYPTIHFEEGDGLSVLLWGPERREQLLGLADLTSETPGYSDVRQVFRRLGAAHRFEWISRKDRQDLLERQRDLERLQKERDAIQLELREYTLLSQEHGHQVANLQARLHDLEAAGAARDDRAAHRIAALEAECEEQAQRLRDAETRSEELLHERFREIATLTSTLEGERTVAETMRVRNADLEARLQELEAESAARDDRATRRIAALEAEREEQAQRLREAKAKFGELLHERLQEIASLTSTLERERLQASTLQRRHNELQETLACNKVEAEYYREQLDLIKSSTFWRMTGPARQMIDRLRAMRT